MPTLWCQCVVVIVNHDRICVVLLCGTSHFAARSIGGSADSVLMFLNPFGSVKTKKRSPPRPTGGEGSPSLVFRFPRCIVYIYSTVLLLLLFSVDIFYSCGVVLITHDTLSPILFSLSLILSPVITLVRPWSSLCGPWNDFPLPPCQCPHSGSAASDLSSSLFPSFPPSFPHTPFLVLSDLCSPVDSSLSRSCCRPVSF